MTTIAFGNVVRFKPATTFTYFFQNFFIGKEMTYEGNKYAFAPFGFSGVTINRTGDGLDATLVFPNNKLTEKWAIAAINNRWIAEVEVLILPNTDPKTGLDDATRSRNSVSQFVGQVAGGSWDNISLNVILSTVLDAVGTDVPRRTLTQETVGNLPVTSSVRLQ